MKQGLQRTCIGCLAKRPKEKLVRLGVEGDRVVSDPTGKVSGRGAYLCKSGRGIKKSCLEKAREKGAFKRAFRKQVKYGQKEGKKHYQKRKTSISTAGGGRFGAR